MHTNRVFQLHELLILAFIQHFTHLKVICGFDFLISQEFPIMHRVLEENQSKSRIKWVIHRPKFQKCIYKNPLFPPTPKLYLVLMQITLCVDGVHF